MKVEVILIVAFSQVVSVHLASSPSKNVLLLKERVPLELQWCKSLGYKETTKINFMKKSPKEAQKDPLYKSLLLLNYMGCSDLVKGFTCALYAPAYIVKYKTALPPCRSLCKNIEKHCKSLKQIMKKIFKKAHFYCDHLDEPSDTFGCVDYTFDENSAKLEMIVKGNPKMKFHDWKVPRN